MRRRGQAPTKADRPNQGRAVARRTRSSRRGSRLRGRPATQGGSRDRPAGTAACLSSSLRPACLHQTERSERIPQDEATPWLPQPREPLRPDRHERPVQPERPTRAMRTDRIASRGVRTGTTAAGRTGTAVTTRQWQRSARRCPVQRFVVCARKNAPQPYGCGAFGSLASLDSNATQPSTAAWAAARRAIGIRNGLHET